VVALPVVVVVSLRGEETWRRSLKRASMSWSCGSSERRCGVVEHEAGVVKSTQSGGDGGSSAGCPQAELIII